jgi:propanol-preferring alcohol dehydrogenase
MCGACRHCRSGRDNLFARGGAVVCGGIHMSDIPRSTNSLLWGDERSIRSAANLTRRDAEASVAPALARLRAGELTGAAVLLP